MSKPLRLITSTEVAKHNTKNDCWVTLYHRKIYDVTDFVDQHPGGADVILQHAGRDLTSIMADISSHEHSESAYEMLDDGMLVGYMATLLEEAELVNNKNKTEVEVTLSKEFVDLTEFRSELPPENLLSIQTDYDFDLRKNGFLDLSKPLFFQLWKGNFSKEFYLDQVHRPRHYGKGCAPFFGNFLEPLSLTSWWIVPFVWLPINLFIFYEAIHNQPKIQMLSIWFAGMLFWTLVEYSMHRFLFHLDNYLPDHPIAITMHFSMHGIHHYLPMDKKRLATPPLLFFILAYPFYKIYFSVMPYHQACASFAGGTLGYIIYDVTHYHIHHSNFPYYFQKLKTFHLEHHYKNYESGFGVTSNFWDKVFGTDIITTFEKKI